MNKRLLQKLRHNAHNIDVKDIELLKFNEQTGDGVFLLHGPPNTPYEGSSFRIQYIVGKNFPFKPPTVTFLDLIWNPFVDYKTGKICCDILNDKWSPAMGQYSKVLLSIQSLLSETNIKGQGINLMATFDMKNKYEKFFSQAKKLALNHRYQEKFIYRDEEKPPPDLIAQIQISDQNYLKTRQQYLQNPEIRQEVIKKFKNQKINKSKNMQINFQQLFGIQK